MPYESWELEHAAQNVAANTALKHHDTLCRNKPCNCSLIESLKIIIEKSWKKRNLI